MIRHSFFMALTLLGCTALTPTWSMMPGTFGEEKPSLHPKPFWKETSPEQIEKRREESKKIFHDLSHSPSKPFAAESVEAAKAFVRNERWCGEQRWRVLRDLPNAEKNLLIHELSARESEDPSLLYVAAQMLPDNDPLKNSLYERIFRDKANSRFHRHQSLYYWIRPGETFQRMLSEVAQNPTERNDRRLYFAKQLESSPKKTEFLTTFARDKTWNFEHRREAASALEENPPYILLEELAQEAYETSGGNLDSLHSFPYTLKFCLKTLTTVAQDSGEPHEKRTRALRSLPTPHRMPLLETLCCDRHEALQTRFEFAKLYREYDKTKQVGALFFTEGELHTFWGQAVRAEPARWRAALPRFPEGQSKRWVEETLNLLESHTE